MNAVTENVPTVNEQETAKQGIPRQPLTGRHETDAPMVDPAPLRIRYRIRFAKLDLLRWISHRDLARLWERLLRRAALKLSMTEGFHPKPRVAFPSALALGVESLDEVVEIELAESLAPSELLKRLASDRQPGLVIQSVHRLPDGFGKAQLRSCDYVITIPDAVDAGGAEQSVGELLGRSTISFQRKNKSVTVSVPEQIIHLRIEDGRLRLTLAASETASLRPGDVLDQMNAGDWVQQGALITRTKVVLQKEYETDDPEQVALSTESVNPSNEYLNRPRPSGEGSSVGPSGPNTQKR